MTSITFLKEKLNNVTLSPKIAYKSHKYLPNKSKRRNHKINGAEEESFSTAQELEFHSAVKLRFRKTTNTSHYEKKVKYASLS